MAKTALPLKLTNVTMRYGKFRGVEDISLSLSAGQIFGFLGPNGAGKTTTINMLLNLTKPTSGKIEIFGKDNQLHGIEIRRSIGYLAGEMSLDKNLTGQQQLEYFGNIRGNFDAKYVSELAERLSCDLSRKIKTLSRGNKQKVALISALMHRPELLILDEPTSGLDPLVQAEFNKIILGFKKEGKTAFISSHVLSEVQELCDQVAFVREGRLIANRPLKEIVRGAPKAIRILCSTVSDAKRLMGSQVLDQMEIQSQAITGVYSGDINKLIRSLSGYKLLDLSVADADLETIFMQYYGDKNV